MGKGICEHFFSMKQILQEYFIPNFSRGPRSHHSGPAGQSGRPGGHWPTAAWDWDRMPGSSCARQKVGLSGSAIGRLVRQLPLPGLDDRPGWRNLLCITFIDSPPLRYTNSAQRPAAVAVKWRPMPSSLTPMCRVELQEVSVPTKHCNRPYSLPKGCFDREGPDGKSDCASRMANCDVPVWRTFMREECPFTC
jgi:hypothetical protein